MPPIIWRIEPIELIQLFEKRHQNPASGALFSWAAQTVESLYYLADLDNAFDISQTTVIGHRSDVVDVAHARWAAGSCITAIDLCAAGLGRAFCAHTADKELDLADFDPGGQQSRRRESPRASLPLEARQWVDAVCADAAYQEIKNARDWLTHSRVRRHFTLVVGGPSVRLELELGARRLPVRQLVEQARNVAFHHVALFLEMLQLL